MIDFDKTSWGRKWKAMCSIFDKVLELKMTSGLKFVDWVQ